MMAVRGYFCCAVFVAFIVAIFVNAVVAVALVTVAAVSKAAGKLTKITGRPQNPATN